MQMVDKDKVNEIIYDVSKVRAISAVWTVSMV